MATADVADTLYANILENLQDTTLHADVAAWGGRVRLAAVPMALPLQRPYLCVTGADEVYAPEAGNARRLSVAVYICAMSFAAVGAAGLLKKFGSVEPFGALAAAVRAALVRPDPYRDGVHITTVRNYTTQGTVVTCWPDRLGAPIRLPVYEAPEEDADEQIHVARPLVLQYEIVEA